ncbi:hypothetical protein CAMSH0001_1961 [Campylobacter showae RM3277]|uniref:Uncharacterized protein n=1 Tax=Campylobacter showae RM3277 TaxID=553219 RepID=C6RE70_9BACT|nr:hypothetical protein CAMSH0001_1961 [Campylobacter showae RM3277]
MVNQSNSGGTEYKKVCFAQIFRLLRLNALAKTHKTETQKSFSLNLIRRFG